MVKCITTGKLPKTRWNFGWTQIWCWKWISHKHIRRYKCI